MDRLVEKCAGLDVGKALVVTRVRILADWPRGGPEEEVPALREALEGRFRTEHHGLLVGHTLAHIDYLDETIATLSERIEELVTPFLPTGGAA